MHLTYAMLRRTKPKHTQVHFICPACSASLDQLPEPILIFLPSALIVLHLLRRMLALQNGGNPLLPGDAPILVAVYETDERFEQTWGRLLPQLEPQDDLQLLGVQKMCAVEVAFIEDVP